MELSWSALRKGWVPKAQSTSEQPSQSRTEADHRLSNLLLVACPIFPIRPAKNKSQGQELRAVHSGGASLVVP